MVMACRRTRPILAGIDQNPAMTTLLTGASGFLGAHTVTALLERGERVRAFVRTPSKLASALSPLGLSPDDDRIEVVTGQMTDADAVRNAVEGCDAVVHAAATYSFRRSDRTAMMRDNTAGTEAVLGAARDAGCRVAVHVSSTVALARPGGVTLDHRSPLGPGHGPYSDSKVASERIARRMQEAGDPVTIVNPGGVIGPHDPYLGETNEILVQVLSGKQPVFPRGRQQFVDVAMPGYLTGWSFLPGSVEGVRISSCGNSVDASRTTADLGVTARGQDEALTDTVRWLVEAGHLPAKLAGRAVS